MRGASVHFAPLGGVGIGMFQLSFAGTNMEKAIHFPSGDHSRLLGESVRRVSWVTAPSASIHRTNTWVPDGSPRPVYAMRPPSGDHLGLEPFTRNRFFEPSTFMIHSAVSQLSFILSTNRRV